MSGFKLPKCIVPCQKQPISKQKYATAQPYYTSRPFYVVAVKSCHHHENCVWHYLLSNLFSFLDVVARETQVCLKSAGYKKQSWKYW